LSVIDPFLEKVLNALRDRFTSGNRSIGPYKVKIRSNGFEFWKTGEEKTKTTEISNNGGYFRVRTPKLWTSLWIDREHGLIIHEIHTDIIKNHYPVLDFERTGNGALRLIKIEFSDSEVLSYIREPDGSFRVHDSRCMINKQIYAKQIPAEILEGETILGETIRLQIDMETEFNKILEDSELMDFYEEFKLNFAD
jgi:hypothetical protein